MLLSAEDRCEICDTIAVHGDLVDPGAHGGLGEVFSPDLDLDLIGVGVRSAPIASPFRALEVYGAQGRGSDRAAMATHRPQVLVRLSILSMRSRT